MKNQAESASAWRGEAFSEDGCRPLNGGLSRVEARPTSEPLNPEP